MNEPDTTVSLTEMRAVAEKATRGKWEWHVHDYSFAELGVGEDPGYTTPSILCISPCEGCVERRKTDEFVWGGCNTPSKADAEFIAMAHPQAVLELIVEIERLRALLDKPHGASAPRVAAKSYSLKERKK